MEKFAQEGEGISKGDGEVTMLGPTGRDHTSAPGVIAVPKQEPESVEPKQHQRQASLGRDRPRHPARP